MDEQIEEPEKPDYMTDEQWERFRDWQRAHPYGDQDENGIDLSLLRANLKLTPTERIERMRWSLFSEQPMENRGQSWRELFCDFVDVGYVLVGEYAMAAYGVQCHSSDVDIAYDRAPGNIERLVRALRPLEPQRRDNIPALPFEWEAGTVYAAPYLALRSDVGDIDLLGALPGIDSFAGLWNRSVEKELCGVKVRVASIDDLISMKRAANRPKDQNHLLELLALKKLIAEEGSAG